MFLFIHVLFSLYIYTYSSFAKVFERAIVALRQLTEEAKNSKGGTVAAVTHSRYLRMILALVSNRSLPDLIASKQDNCCVNVLDIRRDGSTSLIGRKSVVVGGPVSKAPKDFSLSVPTTNVVRTNEIRHLEDLLLLSSSS